MMVFALLTTLGSYPTLILCDSFSFASLSQFITNQTVIDICSECNDPVEACRKIQAMSFDSWMKNDTRTDDITMICIYIDAVE